MSAASTVPEVVDGVSTSETKPIKNFVLDSSKKLLNTILNVSRLLNSFFCLLLTKCVNGRHKWNGRQNIL